MRRVLFLRSNPIDPDPRVEKEALALARAGYSVKALGWDRTASLPLIESKDFGEIVRLSLPAKFGTGLANLPHLLRFQLALAFYLFRERANYDVIHACDFDTLIPSLLAKTFLRKKVIYDIFDFYADMLLKVPSWMRKVVRWLDVHLMGFADAVILADETRLKQISGARPRRVSFIYNSPNLDMNSENNSKVPPLPPPLRIGYVGLLSNVRGIHTMLDVVEKNPTWILELAGFGGDEDEIRTRAEQIPNVYFHGRVSYTEGLRISANSHVLFATYDPSVPNHRFSSANKLFEAMALGRPIIVAKGTGMDALVANHNLGYVVTYGNILELEEALKDVETWTLEKWYSFLNRAQRIFRENFSWSIQEERLVALYKSVTEAGSK